MKTNKLCAVVAISMFSPLLQATDIEVVTVTANRQATSFNDVVGSLSWVNSEALSTISAEHVNQVLVRVPGAWISRGNGQEHLTAIRSPVLTGAGGCGAFLMAQDGISLRAPGFCNANQLFDVNTEQAAQIEVLAGPASTLYGSNAIHGVINVITPSAMDDSYLALDIGPHDYHRAKFALGTQSGDNTFRIQTNLASDGGYKQDSGFDQQKIDLIHMHQSDQWRIKNVFSAANLNQETSGFVQGFEAFKDPELKRLNPNPEAFRDSKAIRAYSQINYSFDDDSSIQVTPYLRWTDMQFLQHFLPWKSLEENGQSSVGVQVQYALEVDNINLLAGVDVDLTQAELTESQAQPFAPTIPAGLHYDYEVDASVVSPFVQMDWQASSDLMLTMGLRYDYTRYEYDNLLSDGSACDEGVNNCRFTRPSDQSRSFNNLSVQAGLLYQLEDNLLAFAKLSSGFRAPQATELFRLQAGQEIAELDSEDMVSAELGIRGFSNSISYQVSAFSMTKENVIFQDTNRQNISDGETSHDGVEVQLRQSSQSGLYWQANLSLANHRYDNDLTLSRQSIKGNEIDTAPRVMGSVQLGWRNDDLTLEGEWVKVGDYNLNPENTASYGGHDLINLRVNYQLNQNVMLSGRILNLLDRDYAERADFGFGNYRYFVGEPRSVFASIRYQWDQN